MYADLDDQYQAGEYFKSRVYGNEPDSPELERWILEELGRIYSPEIAQSLANHAKATARTLRAVYISRPENQAVRVYEQSLADAQKPKH